MLKTRVRVCGLHCLKKGKFQVKDGMHLLFMKVEKGDETEVLMAECSGLFIKRGL